MGSTVVALHSQGLQYEVAWVGDSRAYLWTHTPEGGQLERLTTDHSYVQMLVDTGAIEESEVDHHPDKNIITQCLGSPELEQVHVDYVQGQWQQNQWILLCSDGLTDELDDQTIARLLQQSSTPKAAVTRLMDAALEGGGRDNITLQIIQSPLTRRSPWATLWQWVPSTIGRRSWDVALYGAALLALLLLVYWMLS
jgi:protein phosphatase